MSIDDPRRLVSRSRRGHPGPATPRQGLPLYAVPAPRPTPAADESQPDHRRRAPRSLRTILLIAVSTGLSGWLAGSAARAVAGDKNAPWILGRASGICAYLLLVALVAFGLVLSHPWRTRWRRPATVVRIRIHVSLAVFTLAFLVLHIVVLATDEYAKVGWAGALLPMASDYRPMPVTLGVIATYAGILAGVTASAAGRWAGRVWWPVHKVSALTLVLAWLHGVFTGIDTRSLGWLYAVTALALVLLAASRYIVRTPADRVIELRAEAGAPARAGRGKDLG